METQFKSNVFKNKLTYKNNLSWKDAFARQ